MGSVTLGVDADVATWASGIAAGQGDHLPIGIYGGADYRSAIRFNPPAGWQDWTAITKATLSFYISDHQHVAAKNSSIFVSRMPIASPWTKSEGTQDCESGFSGSNNTQYDDIQSVSNDRVSFSSGTTPNAKKSVVVTAQVVSYWVGDSAKLVFVFDNNGSDQYTELWSEGKSGGYDATLVIEYEDAAVPLAPTLIAPAAGATIEDTTPTFSWTKNDPDPQTAATVQIFDAPGTTLLFTLSVVGAAATVDATTPLTRGTTYQWRARTSDATGDGAWSANRTFTIRALPVVVVSATRRMVFANGAPRLAVAWTVDQPQTHYRVQSSAGYDSGWVAGADLLHTLSTQAVVSGTAQTITVSSRSSYGALEGSDSEVFTPRYGLTTHRRDLTAAPLNWGSPVIVSTVPTDASLVIEYGSDVAAIAAPSAWFSSLAAVPKKRYVFWRAWFIPSSVAGPTLDTITIPVDATVTLVDKWGTARDTPGLVAPWSVDPGEAVYGTRSMTVDCTGAAVKVYSYKAKVRAGRSYILTGLMKSQGNSGAHFRLEDPSGTVLIGGGITVPVGPVQSDILAGDAEWFTTSGRDVNRYKTPVWVAPSDMDVYVVLAAQGAAGAKAWWDAIKLEESTVATPWSPGAIGATVVDAGGVQIDGARGGVFRYKGTTGGARDTVVGGATGLVFGGDVEVDSQTTGILRVGGVAGAAIAGKPPVRRVITATGTWTKPAGLSHIEAEVQGGGGGGGGTAANGSGVNNVGAGGGGGGYAKKLLTAADLAGIAVGGTCAVTVGAAGAGGVAGNNAGSAGGASSFAGTGITTVQGNAGSGGGGMAAGSGNATSGGGSGGSASGGDYAIAGSDGQSGRIVGGIMAMTGDGGGAHLGGSSRAPGLGNPGNTGSAYGGGGTGAVGTSSDVARAGGAGAIGVVIVTEYYGP